MSSPSNAHPELEAEQRHVDAAYERLDAMRRSAVAVAAAYSEVQRGGTHQARLERDVAIETTRRRLAALDIGDAALCFGRLDLESGDRCYVGRIGVDDEEHTPLVVDWRAPVAEPFYRATAVEPLGVVRRRHFQTRGRRILGLDDEVFDREEADRSGLTLVGEGALLAALERVRTGRMADIVATIQAEQDEAIRADLQGPLVVTGGPGTGKTAVALHRAAYLLYTHRRRLGAQGVLLVGPSPVFLRYIDEVLPSLGESDVVLSTLAGLKPGYRVRGAEPDAVAATKGDARMAKVIAKALADRERALPRDVSFVLDGHRLHLTRRESARIAERARRRRGTHNARRPLVARMVLDHLVAQYRRAIVRAYRAGAPDAAGDRLLRSEELARDELAVAAALARGEPAPPEWEQELRVRLRRLPEVREALERMWPVLTGAELVHDLLGFVALIRSAADGTLDRREQLGLHRERSGDVAEVSWTDADLPLIDEADALVGSPSEARSRRRRRTRVEAATHEQAARVIDELGLRGFARVADVLDRYGSDEPAEARADGAEPRRFGHVIVDEAQDLTAMQWRMLARRCPSGSMTLVGDPGQAGRPGALATWEEVLAQLPRLHTPGSSASA
ncbi:MAG: AAA family ATPase [Acidimicrobiia bacterium]|nr:AAA family ATPase [Acidimicrobiia bacterium]